MGGLVATGGVTARELRGAAAGNQRAAAAAAAGGYGVKDASSVRQMQQQMGTGDEMPSPRTKLPQISHAVL